MDRGDAPALDVAGYLALGLMRRDAVPSLAIAPGSALAVAGGVSGLAPWLVELIFGATLLTAGLGLRAAERTLMSHPTRRLDDAVHQRTRLGILAAYLRQTLELTDGNLSRSLSRLQDAGYVHIEKVIEGRRPRTWLSATPAGRTALDTEIAALHEIIARLETSPVHARQHRPVTNPT